MVPGQIDTKFLKNFKDLIATGVKSNHKYVIVTGGGKTARNYAGAAKQLGDLNPDDLDWLGIHATRLNAHLLRTILKKYARPRIITNPGNKDELLNMDYSVIIAAGHRPGFSTDYCAVVLAQHYGINEILNLTDIDYVYDKDPKKYKSAKPLSHVNWKEFRKLVGNKWDPGLNTPFDPIAAALAQRLRLKVGILNGRKVSNVRAYLENKKFIGTIIE
jgi:uridylate kinase